jgi:hypothetical protein
MPLTKIKKPAVDVDRNHSEAKSQSRIKNPKARTRTNRDEYEEATEDPNQGVLDAVGEANEFTVPEIGDREAVVEEVRILPPKDGGAQSIMVSYVIVQEDDDGNLKPFRYPRFFKILNEDGRPNEWGPSFFVRLMSKLGYEKGNRGRKAMAEINEERPGVALRIKKSKQEGFVEIDITGLLDGTDNIVALREWCDENPPKER